MPHTFCIPRTPGRSTTEIIPASSKTFTCNAADDWGKITEAVVTTLWDRDREKKLINDYNAAKEGVFGDVSGDVAQKYIAAYKSFLTERKAVKEQVDSDCDTLKIQ